MHDLGDTVTIAATCRDSAGQPANATTATLVVTLPDGTDTANLAPTNPPATLGQYTHPYPTVQAGRHVAKWTFAGVVPAQTWTDVFHVWPANDWIVGLAETKDHLNIPQTTTTHDDELRRAIAGATGVVEGIVGRVARRTFVETFSGRGGRIVYLANAPAISVTTVVEDGTTLAASAYTLAKERAVLTRVNGVWAVDNTTVTYMAGRAIVQDNILEGTKDLIRANFRPQLGGNRSPYDRADRAPQEQGEMRLGFFVPHSVMERLRPSEKGLHYL